MEQQEQDQVSKLITSVAVEGRGKVAVQCLGRWCSNLSLTTRNTRAWARDLVLTIITLFIEQINNMGFPITTRPVINSLDELGLVNWHVNI